MANPADLNITPQPDTDKNFFNFKSVGLKIDKTYAIKFQWIYDDLTLSDWSPGFFVNTSTESVPAAPTNTVTGGAGFIKVSLPTFPANALRVDVRIAGGTFGSGTVVAESFTSAGVKTIAALGAADPGNAYVVTLLTVTPSKINGDASTPTTVYVTDPSAALVVTAPQDPFAPVVKAGLASVIVEWSGKKSDGTDLTLTGFSGAKVHIGTSSGFTPSADNWVHTLNFANGSNRVSIGVGSVIDKTAGTTLQYGTAYHVKLVAVNASGTTSSAVSASNNPVTVARLPASEIDAGILRADAYIQAGADGGQRAVLSGSTSPFIIYGTDGTTKLLEFLTSGTTGTLAIKGSGTFTGDISGASGTFAGNLSSSGGAFTVNNGVLTSSSGTIGGWSIGSTLTATVSNNTITLNPATPKIALLQSGVEKITIDPTEGIVGPSVTIAGNSGPGFSFSPNGTATIRGAIYATTGVIGGWTLASSSLSSGGTSLNSSGTISLTGGTFSGNGESIAAGNLTLNSGAITSNSNLFLTANDLYYDSNYAPVSYSYPTWVQGTNLAPITYSVGDRCTYSGEVYRCVISNTSTGSTANIPSTSKSGTEYLWIEEANSLLYVDSGANVHLGERGTHFIDLGSKRNALSFRINTHGRGDGYYGRGYVLAALDTSEFKMASINSAGSGYRTVLAGPYGQLLTGRTFYYGSAGSSTAINTEVGGTLGDVYFSTV